MYERIVYERYGRCPPSFFVVAYFISPEISNTRFFFEENDKTGVWEKRG